MKTDHIVAWSVLTFGGVIGATWVIAAISAAIAGVEDALQDVLGAALLVGILALVWAFFTVIT